MDALAAAHDAAVQMIDTCACISTPPRAMTARSELLRVHPARVNKGMDAIL